jgi:hypothetical protein
MAASVPQIPKIVTFTLGSAVSFKEDMVNLRIEPDSPEESSILTLDGVRHKEISAVGWNLVGTAVQDWDSARPGFAWYCWTHQGETLAFVYNAHGTGAESAGSPKFTGFVVISPIGYGGDGNAFATTDFSFPITGVLTLDATP